MKFIIKKIYRESIHINKPKKYINKEILSFCKNYPKNIGVTGVCFKGFIKGSKMPIDRILSCQIEEIDDEGFPM